MAAVAAPGIRGALAGYTPGQRKVIRALDREADQRGASRKLRLAAYETGLVESNLLNLAGGDGSSVNWRQETASSYPNVDRMNLRGSVSRFFDEAEQVLKSNPGLKPGQLAQAVQRSAFPDRYRGERGQALSLLRATRQIEWPGGKSQPRQGVVVGQPSVSRDQVEPGGEGIAALAKLLLERRQPQGVQSQGLAPPAFSARAAMPAGYQAPSSGGAIGQTDQTDEALAAISALRGAAPPRSTVTPGSVSGGVSGERVNGKSSVPGLRVTRDANHGAKALAEFATRGIYGSGERTPEQNAAIGGAPGSDHLTTNRWASAVDAKYGTGRLIARRLGVKGWSPGSYDRHTITVDGRRYSVQILENVEGHYDHTHVGIQRVR